MGSIRVVDVNNEAVGQVEPEQPNEQPIEEAPEQPIEEAPEQTKEDIKNEVVEETNEEPPKKRLTQKDKIQCKKCFKEMTTKSYKYSHEKNCQGQISERPVKPQSRPKQKAKPKPIPPTIQEEETYQPIPQPKHVPIVPIVQQPMAQLAQHYQLLQNEYIKQKQEKYNNLCKNMFATKPKKR